MSAVCGEALKPSHGSGDSLTLVTAKSAAVGSKSVWVCLPTTFCAPVKLRRRKGYVVAVAT